MPFGAPLSHPPCPDEPDEEVLSTRAAAEAHRMVKLTSCATWRGRTRSSPRSNPMRTSGRAADRLKRQQYVAEIAHAKLVISGVVRARTMEDAVRSVLTDERVRSACSRGQDLAAQSDCPQLNANRVAWSLW